MTSVLFFRARRWVPASIVIFITAVLVVLCGPLNYTLNPRSGYLVGVAAQLPILPAVTIQATVTSRALRAKEGTSARKLTNWRLAHIVCLTALAALSLGLAAIPLTASALTGPADQGAVAIVRNLIALTGAALLGATFLGPNLAWVFPLTWTILPFVFLPGSPSGLTAIVTLVAQPDSSYAPSVFAIVLWSVGLALQGTSKTLHDFIKNVP
ncbi:hypothetical protein ACSAGD_14210 [Paramicrobacterium sp. CJ85]|uniref:hypothetical protein n=1 Tax=Paramicrobacterium sp. CJ85 TaxID=3445355 RepID=UPI003F5E7A88